MNIINDKIAVILLKPKKLIWSVGMFTKDKDILLRKITTIMSVSYVYHNVLVESDSWVKSHNKLFSEFKI